MKENNRPRYVLCPRCELNYIDEKDKYCNVCKAELGLVDPGILIPDEEEAGVERLCPVCHVNYIAEDEDICFLCQKEKAEKEIIDENDESWIGFVADEEDVVPPEELEISLELAAEEEEEEENLDDVYHNPDDMDDDFDDDFDDDDYDDEEEDEDEDEDEEDDDDD